MRFKKGSTVEVLSQKEVPSGAWRCAEIISGNGHTYSVRYNWSPGKESQAVLQRVPRKDIRPCPPPVQSVESWKVGDIAEVFDTGFWKMAKVVKILDENYYLARILGSSEEFRVHKYRIRVRQFWNEDKWAVIGKGPDNQMSSQVLQMNARIKLPARNDCLPPLDNTSCQDSQSVSSRSLKRASPNCYFEGYSQKMRAIEKGCEHEQVFPRSPFSLLKKVDAVAYPRENLGEKYMHASFINPTTGFFEKEREKLNGAISCFVERSSELNDCDSDACSVGSCSVISSSSNKLSGHNLAGNSQDADTLSSDAESFCCGGDAQEKFPLSLKEDVAAGIHRLELNAYRSTLVAMHASGSLSWEQEALLTNLRISLHISNDEHLMELRNLISAGTNLHVR